MNDSDQDAAKSTGPVKGLDGRFYTDPAIFEKEKEKIFFRTWQYACHTSQVANPGDYFVFQIANQSLFVVCGANGELSCFYNVCQHRGHELLQGAGNKRNIVCPYHAWRYGLDGKLQFARNSDSTPGFDKSQICLPQVRLEVFCGFVFVNLDDNAKPMLDWFEDAEADLRAVVPNIDDYQPVWEHSMEEQCNWKVAMENYNECYHCPTVHKALTQGMVAPGSIDIQPKGYTLRHTGSAVALDKACYKFDESLGDYRVFFLWPNFSVQVYPGRVVNTYWWRYHNIAHTTVYRGWLTPGGEENEATTTVAKIDKDTTFVEDLSVIESVQRGLASRGYKAGPLILDSSGGIDNEVSTWSLNKWVREALNE